MTNTVQYTGQLPANLFPGGLRIYARVTFDCDGDLTTEQTVVDVVPGRLATYFQHDGLLTTFDFRLVSSLRLLHLGSSWLAASFGRTLPIARCDIQLDASSVRIEPPWPLDFCLTIQPDSVPDAQRIVSELLAQT